MIARDTGELRVSMELLKELGLIEGIERMGWIDRGWDQHVELATFGIGICEKDRLLITFEHRYEKERK